MIRSYSKASEQSKTSHNYDVFMPFYVEYKIAHFWLGGHFELIKNRAIEDFGNLFAMIFMILGHVSTRNNSQKYLVTKWTITPEIVKFPPSYRMDRGEGGEPP